MRALNQRTPPLQALHRLCSALAFRPVLALLHAERLFTRLSVLRWAVLAEAEVVTLPRVGGHAWRIVPVLAPLRICAHTTA